MRAGSSTPERVGGASAADAVTGLLTPTTPFLLTQRLGSVAPLVPRSALERRNFVMVYLHPFVSDLQLSHICLRSSVLIVLIAVTFSPAAQALKLKPSLGTSLTHCRCHCPTPLAVASLSSVPDNP